MTLLLLCKTPSGPIRMSRIQLFLCCFLLFLIIYFLHGHKIAVSLEPAQLIYHSSGGERGKILTDLTVMKSAEPLTPAETSWGAPLVWGDIDDSAWRRAKFTKRGVHVALFALVVGTYVRYHRRFLSSAETYFLPDQKVTYYILTDRDPSSLDPPVKLEPRRHVKVVQVAELPGWDRLAYRRIILLADVIRDLVDSDVEYIFCIDVDQEFVGPVREEILGDLVATLHPELYGMPRTAFPYEVEEVSSACVEEDEGDFYYTSEFYGGSVSEMYKLARACSVLILQDQANKVTPRELEESYLNRYLIDHRPTCVLSPEYSWWDSSLTAPVSVPRLISSGRQCEAYDIKTREEHKC
ncbi:globoside alpha-1,3-N-acetylgalactosaminyltransferase 1-like [Cololabis saira]|uniref:globoside alpha-1,3-N-acetylgalactosaminyltransferase 1-like n=1 Tax=Cololabis saira TaxID=129043 RepID=UPI002AD46CBC|nr:globoside alpha-1,3-N-acetylgalactosaminyltransferase 1-like [Cololabis saira]